MSVNMTVYIEPEMREKLKRKLVQDFQLPTDQTALMRLLLDLYLDGTLELKEEDVAPYRKQRGWLAKREAEREAA